jgi:aminopeptidase YwaD
MADNFYAILRGYDLDFFSIFNPSKSILVIMTKQRSILLNIFRGISISAALFLVVSCRVYQYSTDITESDLHNHLEYLSSDALEGRYPGTVGDAVAGKYLEEQFGAIGLQVQQQDFSFVQSMIRGPENQLEIKGQLMPPESFTPFPFSKDTLLTAPVVFAGYGLTVETDSFKWNDYQGLDIKGKWVLVFRGVPDIPEKGDLLSMSSDDRDKAMLAMDNGAAGILLVSGPGYDPEDILVSISVKQASVGIPALQLSRTAADLILSGNAQVKDLESRIISDKRPLAFPIENTVKAQTDLEQVMGNTSNWIAKLEGSDPLLRNEYIVVGAHYDHLGTGGPGSSSRRPDTVAVHNGADDNASGVSAMLEIAAKLKKNQQLLKRSVLFVAFGAEEMGLLGSKYFVNHSPVELKQIDAMINLDMLGRLDTLKGIQIGGTGTSKEADSLIRLSNVPYGFKLKTSPEGSGPSDHSSFYGKNIPVFFITTGAHEDYHTPEDDADRINYAGLKAVSDLAFRLLLHIDEEPGKLTFREAGPRETPTARSRFKVTLGFMPDFSTTDIEGVRVDFVTKGKAAERGGIKNGDIITAIDGMAIKNIYDYMYRLSKLSKNQIISVELLRNGQKEVLIIQL